MSFDEIFGRIYPNKPVNKPVKKSYPPKKHKVNRDQTIPDPPAISSPPDKIIGTDEIEIKTQFIGYKENYTNIGIEDIKNIFTKLFTTYIDFKNWFLTTEFDISYLNSIKKQYHEYKKESNLYALYLTYELYFKHLLIFTKA